jgi:hypothetical protein
MQGEMFPPNDDFERFSHEDEAELHRIIENEPHDLTVALQAVQSKLKEALDSDAALETVGDFQSRSRKFVIRAHSNDDFPFIHDRIVLIPKRLEQTEIARREIRFASQDDNLATINTKHVLIADYDKDEELIGEYILTEGAYGWYDENVKLAIANDRLNGVVGLNHDPDFTSDFFIAELGMFELERQLNNESSEAA